MSWQTVKTKAGPRLAVRMRAGRAPKSTNSGHRRRHRTIADTAIQAVQIMIVTSNNSIIAAPGFGDPLTRGMEIDPAAPAFSDDGWSAVKEAAGNKIMLRSQ
jgi:hypothetical protein